jgi:hypothetical protein
VRSLDDVLRSGAWHDDGAPLARRWTAVRAGNPWPIGHEPLLG